MVSHGGLPSLSKKGAAVTVDSPITTLASNTNLNVRNTCHVGDLYPMLQCYLDVELLCTGP